MLKFRTEIESQEFRPWIEPATAITLLGSCFADSVGAALARDGFDTMANPMGPLYNPSSLFRCLTDALTGRRYGADDFTPGPMGYHCLDYASRYCGPDAGALAACLNAGLASLREHLTRAGSKLLCLTLGTAYVFYLDGGVAVGNCHKFPGSRFERRRLGVGEIAEGWKRLMPRLPEDLNIVLTVSPIRHLADGLHGNNLSKATLQLAAEEICADGRAVYFPAFEIVNDDLRDYRFYADDLVHPAPQAVAYVWEKFAPAVLTDEALRLLPEAEAIVAAAAHRPRNPQGEAHRAFCRRQLERIAALPEMDFQSETAYFRRCLEINS